MQDHKTAGRDQGHLQQPEAQTAAGINDRDEGLGAREMIAIIIKERT